MQQALADVIIHIERATRTIGYVPRLGSSVPNILATNHTCAQTRQEHTSAIYGVYSVNEKPSAVRSPDSGIRNPQLPMVTPHILILLELTSYVLPEL